MSASASPVSSFDFSLYFQEIGKRPGLILGVGIILGAILGMNGIVMVTLIGVTIRYWDVIRNWIPPSSRPIDGTSKSIWDWVASGIAALKST